MTTRSRQVPWPLATFSAVALATLTMAAHAQDSGQSSGAATAPATPPPAAASDGSSPSTTEPAPQGPPAASNGAAGTPAANALPTIDVKQTPTKKAAKPAATKVKAKPEPEPAPAESTLAKSSGTATAPASGGTGGGESAIEGAEAGDEADAATAAAAKGYAVEGASVGTKTNTPILETPMTVEVVPRQILKEQGTTSDGLSNTLQYLGVQTNGFGAQGETMVFRGFTTSTTLWNGFRIEDPTPSTQGGIGGVWMDNVDRLEVLKGPSSVLYGRAQPGGTVNVVTDKPQKDFHAAFDTGTGSWDQYRFGMDVTGALSADKTLLFRLNASEEDSDSWYRWGPDYVSRAVAPALTWQIAPGTRLSYEGQYRHLEGIGGQPYMPIDANGRPVPVDPALTLLPGNEAEYNQYRSMVGLEQKLGLGWAVSVKYMHNAVDSPVNQAVIVDQFVPNAGSLDAVSSVYFNSTSTKTDAAMVDLTGRFDTFGLKHSLVMGADYYDTRSSQESGSLFGITTDYFHPDRPPPGINDSTWTRKSEESSVYVQDNIELPWNWHVLVGGRYQKVQDHSEFTYPDGFGGTAEEVYPYEKSVFLPQYGVLWKIFPRLSAYYSYAEGMGTITGLEYPGTPIEPESSKQHEVGLKWEITDRLLATAAVFDLTKLNITSEDPAHYGYYFGVGEVESKGFELGLQGSITDNWSVLANVSYARPLVVEGTESPFFTIQPIVAGQLLPYVSNTTVSVWMSYKLSDWVPGWTIGGGYVWSSAANPIDGYTIKTEAYDIASLFASYETNIAGAKTTFRVNVDNLFDERYLLFKGDNFGFGSNVLGGNWGTPREVRANLKMEF